MIEVLLCLVIAINDGDTLKARCGAPGAYQQITVRLAEIDAPEKGQPFGNRSKEALSALCFGVEATISPITRDRYGRTVARVQCSGKDASSEMLRHGMAWRFVRYSIDPAMQPIEDGARASRSGLWSEEAPTPPWEWRKAQSGS